MNNLSESFNSTILLTRDKPIITMMEWIRTYLMSRFPHLREKLSAYTSVVMHKPNKSIYREIEKSGNCFAVWISDGMFEVTQGFTMEKFIVDLTNHTCTCYFWDLVGIPCRHVVAAINFEKIPFAQKTTMKPLKSSIEYSSSLLNPKTEKKTLILK